MQKGFTLIELLVVVLIMGILTAVAVPQYQRAVEKSRAAEALSVLKTIEQAQEVYFLSNGEYATNLSLLDIKIPTSQYFNYGNGVVSSTAMRKSNVYLLGIRFAHHNRESISYRMVCGPISSESLNEAKQICQRLGADVSKDEHSYPLPRWPIVE